MPGTIMPIKIDTNGFKTMLEQTQQLITAMSALSNAVKGVKSSTASASMIQGQLGRLYGMTVIDEQTEYRNAKARKLEGRLVRLRQKIEQASKEAD